MKKEEYLWKYQELCHAMQSGVAFEMEHGSKATEPKHLRVGINTAMCDHSALIKLLIAKGIITDEEYTKAIHDEMAAEVKRYQDRIAETHGVNVTLA